MGFFLRFFQLLIQGIEFLVPFIYSICRSLVNLLSFTFFLLLIDLTCKDTKSEQKVQKNEWFCKD